MRRRASVWIGAALALAQVAHADDPDAGSPAAISLAIGFGGAEEPPNPASPSALAASVKPEVIVGEVPVADLAALVRQAQICVGGRAPSHTLTRVVRVKNGALPYGLTGFHQVAADGTASIVVLDTMFDQTIGHELGHLWFAGANDALDEGRAELVGRCVQQARGVPVAPILVAGSWVMPDLTRFRTYEDAKGLEALVAAYDGSRKLFVLLARLVGAPALLDPEVRYWADVRRLAVASGEQGAWLMGELAKGEKRQRELMADPDHDGANTLAEILAGTDPEDRDSDGDGWIDGKPDDVPADARLVLGDGVPTCLPRSIAAGERRSIVLTMMLEDGQRIANEESLGGFSAGFNSTLLDHTVLGWFTSDPAPDDRWHPLLCQASPDGTVLVKRAWTQGAAPLAFRNMSLGAMARECVEPTTKGRARACDWVGEQYDALATVTEAVATALKDARARAAVAFDRPIPRLLVELNTDKDGVTFGPEARRVGFDEESVRRLDDAASARDLAELAVVMAVAYDGGSIFYARDAWLAIGQDFLTHPAAAEALWWDADRDKVRYWHQRVANCRTGWAGVLARDCF